jgi:FkbM family methyltransferase
MTFSDKLRALRGNLKFDNWPSTVWHRLLFRKEPLLVYRTAGVTFLVDFEGGDQCGTRECLTTDMYSRYFSYLPRNHPLTVLDLGGNGGGFPLSLLANRFALSTCVSVEMNPNTFTRLQFNARYNARRCWQPMNAALAAKSGWIDLDDTKGGTGESMYTAPRNGDKERVRIPLLTFDEIVAQHFESEPGALIDICKIDVEGAEHEVLLSETCQSIVRVGFLVIEIHPTGDVFALIQKIISYGFEEIQAEKPNGEVHFFRNTKIVVARI